MEELQTTEILDREILEDARKKAFKVLKSADDTIKAKSREWENKISEALKELEEKFAGQGRLAAGEIAAILPMDKRRAKAERIESLLRSSVETWYAGLSRERVLDFIKKELKKRLAVCGGINRAHGQCRAVIRKLTRVEAAAVLKEVLPDVPCLIEETQSDGYPEFILENNDVRIYASINKTVDFFLKEKRAELVEALLGKDAVQDGAAS